MFLGEALLSSTIIQALPFVNEQCEFYNLYGPAEITFVGTCHKVNREELLTTSALPIGYALRGYSIYLLDEYHQPVLPDQIGEMFIGGVGVFAGYYGRDDLTAKVLVKINNELCYATGDLARLDIKSGELIFIGRRDFQIKLRGQRIELSAIELIIMKSSSIIINCIVTKETIDNEDHLVAYVHMKTLTDKMKLREELFAKCKSQLPAYMIPTKWIFTLEFPLNINGKIDRKRLNELKEEGELLHSNNNEIQILSPLELKLQDIIMRAFRLSSLPSIRTSFNLLGGTSIGAMRALHLIRQEITDRMDTGVLFANPSVETLAAVLKPMIESNNNDIQEINDEDFYIRQRPSWTIESFGIILLIWQWLWPILLVAKFELNFLSMLFVPFIHLIQYPLFIEFLRGQSLRKRNTLYSWQYYRLWFLKRLWTLNTYWLSYLLGTRFYNFYLRLCGAQIHDNAHIYTTHIDAPWLLKIGDSTYIGDEVVLSSLTYHDRVYELHEIIIGSHCSIEVRSVLHDGVHLSDGVLFEPLSNITGRININNQQKSLTNKFNSNQSNFQLVCILTMIIVHILVWKFGWFMTNSFCLCLQLSISWLIWTILCSCIALVLLACIGSIEENFSYSLNSWQFLWQFWLRKLILSSFGSCLISLFHTENSMIPTILQWLGAKIDNNKDIFLVDIVSLLSIPSNLLIIDNNVTITSSVCFLPFHITTDGQCTVSGPIRLGHRSFIGNDGVIRSGVCILEDTLVGALTRIDSTFNNTKKGK